MTFKCERAFNVRGKEVTTSSAKSLVDIWTQNLGSKKSVLEALGQHDYSRLLWWPQKAIDKVLLWSVDQEPITDWENYKPAPYESLPSINGSTRLANRVFGSVFHFLGFTLVKTRQFVLKHFGKSPARQRAINAWFDKRSIGFLKVFLGIIAPNGEKKFDDAWWRALPMDDQFSDKFAPVKFTELWIPITETEKVMQSLKTFYLDPQNAGTFCSELYAGKQNDFWLSPAYGADMIRVDVFWFGRNAGDPEAYFQRFWQYLKPFKFRYHWGKYIGFVDEKENLAHISPLYPKWNHFMALRKLHDPYNLFLNHYWKKYLSIPGNVSPHGVVTDLTTLRSNQQNSNEIPIIDLHCHPALKVYLFNKNIRHKHIRGPTSYLLVCMLTCRV